MKLTLRFLLITSAFLLGTSHTGKSQINNKSSLSVKEIMAKDGQIVEQVMEYLFKNERNKK